MRLYKDQCFELLNKKIIKTEQTSDWGSKNLTLNQTKYAATDVLYLHKLKERKKMSDKIHRI